MRVMVIENEAIRECAATELASLLAGTPDNDVAHTIWVDMVGPTAEDVQVMEHIFRFHPLTIEDTRNHHQRPSVQEYADYYFAILNPLAFEHGKLFFRELDVFIGKHYLVTVRISADSMAQQIIDRMMSRLKSQKQAVPQVSSAYLMYLLADEVVNCYFPVIDRIGLELDHLEEEILEQPRERSLKRVFTLKRNLMELWRVTGQQRDMFSLMTNRGFFTQSKVLRYYFRDTYDHLLRINDMISTYRDVITGLMDLYMSAVSNRLNRIVQRLSVITIVTGVFTVISGFYGMNFEYSFPPFDAPWATPVVTAVMVTLGGAVVLYLRAKKYF
jgi:magnesium transporter